MKSPEHQKRHVSEYVELEAHGEKVKRAEKISSEKNKYSSHDIWDVETNKDRYWVITDPTNLYSQSEFPSMDYALSFHVGLMTRMYTSRHTNATDEEIWKTPKTWRQLEQAHETFETSGEAEDYQSIGVKCREILITFVGELSERQLVIEIVSDIKKADVKGQLETIYNKIASGGSMRKTRAHLKNSSDNT